MNLSLPDKCPICNSAIISSTTRESHCSNEFVFNMGRYYHFWQERFHDYPHHFGLRIPECILLMAIFINNKWFIFNEKDFEAIYNSRDYSLLSKVAIKEFEVSSFEEAYIVLKNVLYFIIYDECSKFRKSI